MTVLEHVNFTVSDPEKIASTLCQLFDWHIRWQGSALGGGRSVHVGSEDNYIALYSPNKEIADSCDNYSTRGGLNHVGVVVDNLDEVEQRILKAGFETFSHADYEPGRRFYFHIEEGVEFEVVSYQHD
ncbi:MAG: VOC family protein [Rhizobiaceae bacterium]|nr:VOC family protein [Rhizobiaceae bacterium]